MEFGNLLMTIPTFKKGDKLWAADLQTLADAVRANRVLPGAGIRITGGPNGTTVAANIPRGAKSGTMTLHQVDFEDLIPDPFKIMQEVMDEILNAFYEALPTAEAIAGVIENQLLNMDDYMPTAEAVAAIIQSRIESYLIGGGGAELSFETLFDSFANSAPGAEEIASMLMPYFQPALDVMEGIDALVQEKYEAYANVGTLITAHFAGANAGEGEDKPSTPSPGDYLYCEEFGILYTVFPVGYESGIPTANLVWRVHFQVGSAPQGGGEDTRVWWCALTTFPAPDIGAICRMLGRIGEDLIKKSVDLIAGPVAGLTKTFAGFIKMALSKLDEIPDAVGRAVKAALDLIWDAINALAASIPGLIANALQTVWDEINRMWDSLTYALDNVSLLWQEITKVYAAITSVQEKITEILADIALLKNPTNSITYVGHDGQLYTAPSVALGTCIGVTKQMDIDWIGIDGNGHAMKVLMWDGTYMPEAVNSETLELVNSDGDIYEVNTVGTPIKGSSIKIDVNYLDNNGEPQKIEAFAIQSAGEPGLIKKENIEICVDGSAQTKTFLVQDAPG